MMFSFNKMQPLCLPSEVGDEGGQSCFLMLSHQMVFLLKTELLLLLVWGKYGYLKVTYVWLEDAKNIFA